MASSAIKTGVEQGEENIPPNIPARNAPTNPLFLLFDSRLADGMRLNTPHVCKAINTIKAPRTRYQIGEELPMSLPAEVAMIPKLIKVIAVPTANTAEYAKYLFCSFRREVALYVGYNQNQHAEQHHDFDCVVDEKLNAAADFPGGI